MRLYLVQHGGALTKAVDPERHLSEQGEDDIKRLAAWLVACDITLSRIWHSDKIRARQSAELLAPALRSGGHMRPMNGLGPNDPPGAFLERLQDADDDTLIVSHLPFVARVLSQAVSSSPDQPWVEFQPGSIAAVERDDNGMWHLIFFARPGLF